MNEGCEVRGRYPVCCKVAKLYLDENVRGSGLRWNGVRLGWIGKETVLIYLPVVLFLEGSLMFPFYSVKEKENITFDLILLHR